MQQPVEPGWWWLFAIEGQGPFVEVDGRVERGILKMRRAAPLDDGGVHFTFNHLSQHVLLHRVDQARFAQAWFAAEQDDLPHAFSGPLPAIPEQAHFQVAARQRRELRRGHGVDWTPGHRGVLDAEQLDGVGNALDLLASKGDALKLPLEQAVADLGTDDLPGDSHVFEPDGHVPCVTHQRHGARPGLDDRCSGVNTDPRIQVQRVATIRRLFRPLHRVEDRAAGPGGAAGGVLVRDREPVAGQQPLVGALHDRAAELTHRFFAPVLERPQHTGLFLRVEFQVGVGLKHLAASDQHGQLTTLGVARGTPGHGRRAVPWKRRRRWRGRPVCG